MTAPSRQASRIPEAPDLPSLVAFLRLLADPTRLQIVESLLDGVQCNCEIKAMLGLPMNLISHHLKILKEAGLVRAERDPNDARWIYYEIDPEALEALRKSLFLALDPRRIRPRKDRCGPSRCCPPENPSAERPSASYPRRTP